MAFALCWHLPIFTPRRQGTIFGTTELNFRVRDGNGWTLSVIDTNSLSFDNDRYFSTLQPKSQILYCVPAIFFIFFITFFRVILLTEDDQLAENVVEDDNNDVGNDFPEG